MRSRPKFGTTAHVDPIVAAGERIPTIGEAPDALPERERDHQEIDTAGADCEQPEQSRQRRPEQNSHDDDQPEIPSKAEVHFGREHRSQVGANAEIGRLSHR